MTEEFNIPFARLVPVNALAVVLVRKAVEYLGPNHPDQLKYYVEPTEEPIEDAPVDGETDPEVDAATRLTAGFFQMSFDREQTNVHQGWHAGRIPSAIEDPDRRYRVDFVLEPPNVRPKSRAISPLQLRFYFHRHSGVLLVQNLDRDKVVCIAEDTKLFRLRRHERRVLSQRRTSIHLRDAHFAFEFTIPNQSLDSYFNTLKKYFSLELQTRNARFVRCLPGINSWRIGCIDAMILEHTAAGGTFGTVQEAVDLSTGEALAIKRLRHGSRTAGCMSRQAILHEWRIARLLSGKPGIIRTLDLVCEHGHSGEKIIDCNVLHEYIYLVTQLGHGDFDKFDFKEAGITPRQRLMIYRDTLIGISSIHNMGYAHRDIQPGNLLVLSASPQSPSGCVIDFGKAVQVLDGVRMYDSRIGPPYSLAPEVLTGNGYTKTIDLFSWAITITRSLGVRLPWLDRNSEKHTVQPETLDILRHNLNLYAVVEDDFNPLADLLLQILRWDEKDRLTVDQAVNHECWKGLDRPTRSRSEEVEDTSAYKRQKVSENLSSQNDSNSLPSTIPFSSEKQ